MGHPRAGRIQEPTPCLWPVGMFIQGICLFLEHLLPATHRLDGSRDSYESLWLQLYVERLTALKSLNRAFHGSTIQIGDRRIRAVQRQDSLWTLFHKLGVYSYASWKVDKIFALIGISGNGRPEVIDYERTPEDIYIQAAVEFLHHVGLDILRLKQNDSIDSLPSWVPT